MIRAPADTLRFYHTFVKYRLIVVVTDVFIVNNRVVWGGVFYVRYKCVLYPHVYEFTKYQYSYWGYQQVASRLVNTDMHKIYNYMIYIVYF